MTVCIAASIPNPLFDLAGLTCGHFQIPFCVFFLSTFIGKAINKVSIQVIFMIIAFSKELLAKYLRVIKEFAPGIANTIQTSIDKQQANLFGKKVESNEPEPLIKQLWGYVMIGMILYFVVSFFNAIVREQLVFVRTEAARKKK